MKFVKAVVIFAFLSGFLFSPRLWTSNDRFFPVIRPVDNIPIISFPFDIILLLLFLGSGILWIFYKKRSIGLMAIGSLLTILIQDQMRWQPWVYLYLLLLLPYLQSNKKENEKSILCCLQWIIAGVYVWSGIHKLNPNFINQTFAQMISVSGIDITCSKWKNAGYIIPVIEIATGLSLLSPNFRKMGIYAAVIMHVVILLYLSPMVLNYNSIVYPWNVAMILFVILLFAGVTDNPFRSIPEMRYRPLGIIPLVLVWLCPIFNISGYWDHYLSFSLYSDKPSTFYIAIEETELRKLDKRFQHYFANIPGLQGGQLIDIDKWALSELNVPFYPQQRLFKKLGSNFCHLNIKESGLLFVEVSYSNAKQQYSTFTCAELKTKQ